MKYYKTQITVDVISDRRYPTDEPVSLADVQFDITEGECAGRVEMTVNQEITQDECEAELEKIGCDPEFLIPEDDLV